MDSPKLIQFPNPTLNDISGMLRRMADQIETGEWGKVEGAFLLIPIADDYPKLFGWGNVTGLNEPLVQLELAKHWLCQNLVSR